MKFGVVVLFLISLLTSSHEISSQEWQGYGPLARKLQDVSISSDPATNATASSDQNSTESESKVEEESTVSEASKFASGFSQSFILIFVSEIGDKTFILVTIYAAKMKWWIVLLIASLGMCCMHTLSTGLGTIFVLFVPKLWTEIIAIALFWGMGCHAIFVSVREYR